MYTLVIVISACLLSSSVGDVNAAKSDQGLVSLATSVNKFAAATVDVFFGITDIQSNILESPFNIYEALILLWRGTRGSSRKQLARALRLDPNANEKEVKRIVTQFGQLVKKLTVTKTSTTYDYETQSEKNVTIEKTSFAAGVFPQSGCCLKPDYVAQVRRDLGATVQSLDYRNNAAKATQTMNEYVNNKTNGLIEQLFSESVSSDTIVELIATLYIAADWAEGTFTGASARTSQGTFKNPSGSSEVSYMRNIIQMGYFEKKNKFKAGRLDLKAEDFAVLIVLPDENSSPLELITKKYLNANEVFDNLKTEYVDIALPKFNINFNSDISGRLKALNILDVFDERKANFGDLIGNCSEAVRLVVSSVQHGTTMKANEEGILAAAATAIGIRTTAVLEPPKTNKQINCTRPFYVLIYHLKLKIILFWGLVYNPRG